MSEDNQWVVPFVFEDGKLLCELTMSSIPSEGPSLVHTDGKTYKMIKVEGDRKTKKFTVTVREDIPEANN